MKRYKLKILPKVQYETPSAIYKAAVERFESDRGYKPTAFKIAGLLGGDISQWGRIMKGVAVAKGPYLAKLKILKEYGFDSNYILACAEKTNRYGHKNRKGNLVIHSLNIFNDQQKFYEDRIFDSKMQEAYFDDPDEAREFYFTQLDQFYSEGQHCTGSFEEELELQREFYKSL